MASSSLTVTKLDDSNVVFTLVGVNSDGASYKDATRTLQLPRTLDFKMSLGTPGSLGNDRMTVTFRNSVMNATTQKIVTIQAKLELSVPRDSAITATDAGDILAHFQQLLVDAKCQSLAAGLVP